MLKQIAVRLTVEVEKTMLVRVATPNANKKRLASVPSGTEKPGCISSGITTSSGTDSDGTSIEGSLFLEIKKNLFQFTGT